MIEIDENKRPDFIEMERKINFNNLEIKNTKSYKIPMENLSDKIF